MLPPSLLMLLPSQCTSQSPATSLPLSRPTMLPRPPRPQLTTPLSPSHLTRSPSRPPTSSMLAILPSTSTSSLQCWSRCMSLPSLPQYTSHPHPPSLHTSQQKLQSQSTNQSQSQHMSHCPSQLLSTSPSLPSRPTTLHQASHLTSLLHQSQLMGLSLNPKTTSHHSHRSQHTSPNPSLQNRLTSPGPSLPPDQSSSSTRHPASRSQSTFQLPGNTTSPQSSSTRV